MPFASVAASLGILAARRPAFYGRHRTLLAAAFRLAYAGVANAAIAGTVARVVLGSGPSLAHHDDQQQSTRLRFWAERTNPVILAVLGLTSGLGAGPLALLCAGQLALLSAGVGPACRALEARHPSHPGRFAEAASAFSNLAGGLLATLVGDAATFVDVTGVGGAGGGGGGGGARGGHTPSTSSTPTTPLHARVCPHRTCALVMTQLYMAAFAVAITTTLASARRQRAAAAGAPPAGGPGLPWWRRSSPLDRHSRVAVLEAGAAVFVGWLLLTAVDGWAGCPA
jgi:hypothetical protein